MSTYEETLVESPQSTSYASSNPKWMTITGWVLTALTGGLLIFSAVMKLMQTEQVLDGFKQMGFPEGSAITIGILELVCALIYLVPRTAILGGILVAAYLGGATCMHVQGSLPVTMPVAMGVVAWLGLYLRDARVRALLPLRTKP